MKTVKVRLGKRSYNVYIGVGVTKKIPSLLKLQNTNIPLFVITNKKINSLHGRELKRSLGSVSKKVKFFLVPDSEKAKSFAVYTKTMAALARFARRTKPILFAFGGGVIGDLAGFVASTYRRGIPYVQIPTTLLGQVDSAIGGKVAIDIKEAKNIVGNFYQPKLVICELRFLKTLPKKEVRNGLVEVVKYGIIKDGGLFSFLERNMRKILKVDTKTMAHIVARCATIKARVVEEDEFDTKDVRAILNFGHTIGHAIEAASRYSESIKHGRAVAAGMIMASYMAFKLGLIEKRDSEKIHDLVRRVLPKTKRKRIKATHILNALWYDKKFTRGVTRFILPEKIGLVKVIDNIPQSLIKEAIKKFSI